MSERTQHSFGVPRHLLRCLAFDGILYPLTIVSALFCLPALFSRVSTKWVAGRYVAVVMWLIRHVLGIVSDFQPGKSYPEGQRRILAVKHQSAWETLALRYYYPNAVGVAKRGLFWLPFGWYMWRLGYIPIDRGGGTKTLRRMIRAVHQRLDAGMDVIIYPEGTRRLVGAPPAYKTGIFALYRHCAAEVLPITHDSGKTWGCRPLYRQPGVVQVREGTILPLCLDKETFMRTLQQQIENDHATL